MDKSVQFWDKVSKKSNKGTNKLEESNELIVKEIAKYIKQSDDVLDYGCGLGKIANEVAILVNKVDGIDISSGMIEAAKANAIDSNLTNVCFTQMDILDLDHGSKTYDVILANNVLPYVENPKLVYEKIYDLLRPGGLFISSTGCLGERVSLLSILVPIVSKIGVMPKFKSWSIQQLHQEISNCRFKIIDSRNLSRLPDHFIVARKQ